MALAFYIFLFVNPFGIYEATTLKWIPVFICIISLFFSGKINKKTPIKLLPILFIPFVIFDLFNYTYFPFILVLIVTGVFTLFITRDDQSVKNKRWAYAGIATIFLFFLFTQPLIIYDGDYTYDDNGNLTNVNVIWDFSEKRPLKLPSHLLVDTKKADFDMIDIKGKTHFITFWATWCGPCIKDKPELERLKKEFARNSNVEFIDISFDDIDMKKWKQYIEDKQPNGIQLISKSQKQTSRTLNFSGIPMHFIVDSDGSYREYKPFHAAKKALYKTLTK